MSSTISANGWEWSPGNSRGTVLSHTQTMSSQVLASGSRSLSRYTSSGNVNPETSVKS